MDPIKLEDIRDYLFGNPEESIGDTVEQELSSSTSEAAAFLEWLSEPALGPEPAKSVLSDMSIDDLEGLRAKAKTGDAKAIEVLRAIFDPDLFRLSRSIAGRVLSRRRAIQDEIEFCILSSYMDVIHSSKPDLFKGLSVDQVRSLFSRRTRDWLELRMSKFELIDTRDFHSASGMLRKEIASTEIAMIGSWFEPPLQRHVPYPDPDNPPDTAAKVHGPVLMKSHKQSPYMHLVRLVRYFRKLLSRVTGNR